MKRKHHLTTAPLEPLLRQRIANLIRARGEAAVLTLIPIPTATLSRALAGLTIRAGTAALIAKFIAQFDERQAA